MNWYLLQVKHRQESIAEVNLMRQGFGCYQPMCPVEKLVAGKLVDVNEPLFPGYMFVGIGDAQNWSTIRSTYGVKDLVRFGGRALPVPEKLLNELRLRCASFSPQHLFKVGQRVEVKSGPFSGVSAIFKCRKGADRVVVLISLLHTEQQIVLHPSELDRCG